MQVLIVVMNLNSCNRAFKPSSAAEETPNKLSAFISLYWIIKTLKYY